jgi:putative endonuclease
MENQVKKGSRGEAAACAFLIEQGFHILERNWRFKRAEVDIIARDGETLVFIEVKARKTEYFGPPEAFVSPRKQRMLASAASAFCHEWNHTGELRFDVAAVLFSEKDFHVTLIRDAFFPGLT